MSHTPTPWKIGLNPGPMIYATKQGVQVADLTFDVVSERHANALHIVKCVNSHDSLIAALESFVTQATKLSAFPEAYQPYVGALVQARAILEQVKK